MLKPFGFFFFFLLFFCFFFSKVRVGAKEGGSHYWEMAVAITCGYGGYLLPLLAAHSSFICKCTRFTCSVCLQLWMKIFHPKHSRAQTFIYYVSHNVSLLFHYVKKYHVTIRNVSKIYIYLGISITPKCYAQYLCNDFCPFSPFVIHIKCCCKNYISFTRYYQFKLMLRCLLRFACPIIKSPFIKQLIASLWQQCWITITNN